MNAQQMVSIRVTESPSKYPVVYRKADGKFTFSFTPLRDLSCYWVPGAFDGHVDCVQLFFASCHSML